MSYLEYDAGAAALVRALEDASHTPNAPGLPRHQLRLDRAMVALLRLPAPDAIVPELLGNYLIWDPSARDQIASYVDGGEQTYITQPSYENLLDLVAASRKLAEEQGAPSITEWHIVSALIDRRGKELGFHGLRTEVLRQRVAAALDIRAPSPMESGRTWCFCDTTFFLEGRFFDEVDWHKELGLEALVLAVVPAIMDELDDWRFNERRPRQQQRARSVVRRMDELTAGHPQGEPARVRGGVEMVRLGWEPRHAAPGLTAVLADDRLVSSGLEYRWRRPGLDVQVLAEDRGPCEKARRLGLTAMSLPNHLLREPEGRVS